MQSSRSRRPVHHTSKTAAYVLLFIYWYLSSESPFKATSYKISIQVLRYGILYARWRIPYCAYCEIFPRVRFSKTFYNQGFLESSLLIAVHTLSFIPVWYVQHF